MSSSVTTFSWRFGGPLADLPPALAWSVLGALGVAGLVWIILNYRRTLVTLTPRRRATLTSLRVALWLVLLLALAGPTRIERTYAQKQTRPLAIVLDRSDSMTAADNRGTRRADDALRRWRALAPAAQKTFGDPKVFAFADDFTALSSTDATASLKTGRTRVFRSLQSTLDAAPPGGWGAVVLLTDGLDTGEDVTAELDKSVGTALAAATPVFSLPGRNRFAGGEFLTLRDLTVPSQVPPRSQFTFELTLESFQSAARSVPVRLRVGNQWRPAETLVLPAGRRAVTWSADIAAGAPGNLPLELVIGEGASAVSTRSEVRIAAPDTTRILYYQGSLDWGYRFLSDILRRDPAFALTPIFNLAPEGAPRSRTAPAGALPDLPDTAAGLDAFDVVVLANAAASQFNDARQAALTAWVRAGGVLLFLAPDDDATHGYSGTEMERMLPVVFTGDRIENSNDAATADFRRRISQFSGGAHGGTEAIFASQAKRVRGAPALSSFEWVPEAAGLIGADTVAATPRFANYARVDRAKPGATVLARHPSEKASDGNGAILLALQRYGRGQSAVLTSDALWRWKLNQPSKERGVEVFWQNLLAWLARERPRGPRFERTPLTAETGREVVLRSAGGRNPRLTAQLDTRPAVALPSTGQAGGSRLHTWTPASAGLWLLTLTDEDNRTARHWLSVSDAAPAGENSGLPPDEALLQEIARRTGGSVLENTAPSAWLPAAHEPGADLLREQRTPLWHGGALLAALLALYAAELLLRRRWQLL